jgi:hypothetical protein
MLKLSLDGREVWKGILMFMGVLKMSKIKVASLFASLKI